MLTCASAAARVVIVLAGLTGRIQVCAVLANASVVDVASGVVLVHRTVSVECTARLDALSQAAVVANVADAFAIVAAAAVTGVAPTVTVAGAVNERRLNVVI